MHYVGWDLGGAHIKAALLNSSGVICKTFLVPCPLWKGLNHLSCAMSYILNLLPHKDIYHAITMTGELVDLFDNREEGVKQIIKTSTSLLLSDYTYFYAGHNGLITNPDSLKSIYSTIASANWLASANYIAQKLDHAILIDIGSTTTDIIVISDGQVKSTARSDYERLISQELVYTGIIRTPVMAITQSIKQENKSINLVAEYFATMADVYRMTGELNELSDHTETADGGSKTIEASARRLARMIACDFETGDLNTWHLFAKNIRQKQIQKISKSLDYCQNYYSLPHHYPLIGAGIGHFLIKEIADSKKTSYIDINSFFYFNPQLTEYSPSDIAPAAALSFLLKHKLETENVTSKEQLTINRHFS